MIVWTLFALGLAHARWNGDKQMGISNHGEIIPDILAFQGTQISNGSSNGGESMLEKNTKTNATNRHIDSYYDDRTPSSPHSSRETWKRKILDEGKKIISQIKPEDGDATTTSLATRPETSTRSEERTVMAEDTRKKETREDNPNSHEREKQRKETERLAYRTHAFTATRQGQGQGFDPTQGTIAGAADSGPFGVPIWEWFVIGVILLVLLILALIARKYIRTIVRYIEQGCYWLFKIMIFPLLILFRGFQAIFYPIKEFCYYTSISVYEYCYPWSVTS
ncbi:hypothetical protein AAMO2058_000931300 [Amorphochlora amoebiformis]